MVYATFPYNGKSIWRLIVVAIWDVGLALISWYNIVANVVGFLYYYTYVRGQSAIKFGFFFLFSFFFGQNSESPQSEHIGFE